MYASGQKKNTECRKGGGRMKSRGWSVADEGRRWEHESELRLGCRGGGSGGIEEGEWDGFLGAD